MSTVATVPAAVTSNIWMELAIVGVPKLIDVVLALVAAAYTLTLRIP